MVNFCLDPHYHRSQLPNDVEALKDIIDEVIPTLRNLHQQNILLQKQVEELQKQNSHLLQQNNQLQQRVEQLENQVALLKRNKFGKKSEKLPPAGGSSSGGIPKLGGPPQKHPGRHALPQHLPRVRVEHDLDEADKVCPLCQEPLTKIQEVVSEQLDVIPAQAS